MDSQVAKGIYKAGKDYYPLSLRENYSGRNMFGGLTTALLVEDEREFVAAATMYAWEMAKATYNPTEGDLYGSREGDFDELINSIRSYRVDNLGHQIIIY